MSLLESNCLSGIKKLTKNSIILIPDQLKGRLNIEIFKAWALRM